MNNKEILRKIIRELIKQELEEATTTDGAGGFLTPMAFRGNSAASIAKNKRTATDNTGYELTARGKKDADSSASKLETVSENKYYAYRNDTTKTPRRKIAEAISQLNKNLCEVERVLKMNTRLKNESGINSEQLWKRTQQGLIKLEAKLLGIATRIREIRGQ